MLANYASIRIERGHHGPALICFAPFSDEVVTIFQSKGITSEGQNWNLLLTFPSQFAPTGLSLPNFQDLGQSFFRIESSPFAISDRMVWIAPGRFSMGSPTDAPDQFKDEGPQHEVEISQGFWMCKYEVTQREYEGLIGYNPSKAQGDPNRPVENVTWKEAVDYCSKLTRRARADGELPPGYVYRLPTEAEWEYACRAGTTTAYSFGDDASMLNDYAWWSDNAGPIPHVVGKKLPNPWGLYDMHGNVFEWCLDRYEVYPGGEPFREFTVEFRVVRSGGFPCPAYILRSACRFESAPATARSWMQGFRIVLAPER